MTDRAKHWPLWVVEMNIDGAWHPTVGVTVTRDQARSELEDWQERNPDDKFRLRQYIRK